MSFVMKNNTASSLVKGLALSFLLAASGAATAEENVVTYAPVNGLKERIQYDKKTGMLERISWHNENGSLHHPFKPALTLYDRKSDIVTLEEWYKYGKLQRRIEYSPRTCLPLSDTSYSTSGTYQRTEFMSDTGIKTKETSFKSFESQRITVYEPKDGLMTYDEWRDDERTTYVTHDSSGTNRVIPILRSY